MIIVDSITRLIDGAIGNKESLLNESHSNNISAEYPQYTRPAIFNSDEGDKWEIPEILLSGDHKRIEEWRKQNSK
jgi:tRNA (guanine37-N1)-methyltransferase